MANEPVTGNTTINNLRDKRLQAWNQATALADRAYEENREMSSEEQRQFDEWDAEMTRLDSRIQALCAGEQRAKQTEEAVASITRQPVSHQQLAVRGSDGAWAQTSSDGMTYEQANEEFRKMCRGEVRAMEFNWPSTIERRALSATTDVPMPTSFIHQLYVYLVDTSSVRQAGATVISTTTGEQILVPRSTAEGTAVWMTEASAISGTAATLGSVTLGSNKVGKLITVSKELATDVGFDLVGYLAQSSGRNIGIATNGAYCTGASGATTTPKGILSLATVGVTAASGVGGGSSGFPTATAGEYGADYLVDLYHSVIPQYRPRAAWMMNDSSIKIIRRLKDSLGRFIWEPSLQAGVADTLLGKPVYANPAFPAFATGATIYPIAFGDFSAYYIRDVTPLRFERSDEYLFANDQIAFRALMRTDGNLVDTNAIKLFQCPTA